MKHIKYVSSIYGISFLCLCAIFLFISTFSFVAPLFPINPDKTQDFIVLAWVFSLIAFALFIIAILCKLMSYNQKKRDELLLVEGVSIIGKIENVNKQKLITFCFSQPYKIIYSYYFNGGKYSGKSYLMWDLPKFNIGDSIEIYVDNMGNSVIKPLPNQNVKINNNSHSGKVLN